MKSGDQFTSVGSNGDNFMGTRRSSEANEVSIPSTLPRISPSKPLQANTNGGTVTVALPPNPRHVTFHPTFRTSNPDTKVMAVFPLIVKLNENRGVYTKLDVKTHHLKHV